MHRRVGQLPGLSFDGPNSEEDHAEAAVMLSTVSLIKAARPQSGVVENVLGFKAFDDSRNIAPIELLRDLMGGEVGNLFTHDWASVHMHKCTHNACLFSACLMQHVSFQDCCTAAATLNFQDCCTAATQL